MTRLGLTRLEYGRVRQNNRCVARQAGLLRAYPETH